VAYSFLAFRNGGFFDMISNLMGLNIIQYHYPQRSQPAIQRSREAPPNRSG
jgi:hypothetical protein